MAEFPFMPLYTDALIADTDGMTTEAFGAYVRILCSLWRHGGRLPNDAGILSRIAGCSRREWSRVEPAIMPLLTVVEDTVSQKRITSTILRTRETRRVRAMAGRRGAASRWKQKNGPWQ